MTTINIELPDETAKAAREAGLLTPQALDRLLSDAIRRKAAADCVAAAGIGPMPAGEIDAEVKALRAERRQRAGGY